MFLGRFQLGTWLEKIVQCRDLADTPTLPDATPHAKVYRASDGTMVYSQRIPLSDRTVQVGLFTVRIFLGSDFAVGQHSVEVVWSISPAVFMEQHNFEIVPGGNSEGQVLATAFYHRPEADFVVYQTESGTIFKGRNPVL